MSGTFAGTPAVFLTPSQYDPPRLLPPPPNDNSAAAKAELAELKEIERTRSPAQLARARSDDKTENASIFAEIIGPGFDLKALPATARMFADIRREEQAAANAAKDFFKRNRPWIVDSSMASCSKDDAPQSSYPSGHATMGFSMGVVLASLAPEKAQAILARANEYAENRLVCGMHFRRDIEAGTDARNGHCHRTDAESRFQGRLRRRRERIARRASYDALKRIDSRGGRRLRPAIL